MDGMYTELDVGKIYTGWFFNGVYMDGMRLVGFSTRPCEKICTSPRPQNHRQRSGNAWIVHQIQELLEIAVDLRESGQFITSWWLQPISKIFSVNGSSPQVGVKIKNV